MKKDLSIIGALRPSLIGDVIVSTSFLNYLEKKYPNSFKVAFIDKKCNQIIPFLINHPLIDRIKISERADDLTNGDSLFFDRFDIKFHPFSQHPYQHDYWNYRHFSHETFLMNYEIGKGYINPSEWETLTKEETYPKLTQWFDVERTPKTIAIWPFSGYSKNNSIEINLRSPSKEWWNKLVEMLSDYKIIQLGHPSSELLDNPNIIDCRKLSLFDAAKLSLGCDVSITTDSGIGWILGAYGAKQIVLYTNYAQNHNVNLDCYVPLNHKRNLIPLFGYKGINNIIQENVVSQVKNIIA